jgi:hypothetical protein
MSWVVELRSIGRFLINKDSGKENFMHRDEEQALAERIRVRAYHLWEQEGRPEGRADAHWDQATELVAIEDNQRLATKPVAETANLGPTGEPVEPLGPARNLGEFPTLTDQGEERTLPQQRTVSNQGTSGARSPARGAAAKPALNGTQGARAKKSERGTTRAPQ